MQTKPTRPAAALVAMTLVAGLTLEATVAAAQPPPPPYDQRPYDQRSYDQQSYDQRSYDHRPYDQQPADQRPYDQRPSEEPGYGPQVAPPSGEYAPPPPGYERQGAVYDDRAQRYDRDYADRYSRWAQQYCIDRRNNNKAAGAVIGGILGAVVGSNVSGRGSKTGGSIIGGALGAVAGAAIAGNSTDSSDCPPGYYVRSGAPTFYYPPPAYGPPVTYAPGWYNPWAFEGGIWVYRPYRYWYWTHDTYWRPDWRPGRWNYHYRRW